jgi:hypothetical protein
MFMDKGEADGGKPGMTMAMEADGVTPRRDKNNNKIFINRKFDASNSEISKVLLPSGNEKSGMAGWVSTLKPEGEATTDIELSNIIEYLSLQQKKDALDASPDKSIQQTQAYQELVNELFTRRNDLEKIGQNGDVKLSVDDVINRHIDYSIATMLEGRAVGGQTKRSDGGANTPSATTGYTAEGVPTGETNADGTPVMTTPETPTRPVDTKRGYQTNERQGGAKTIGDVYNIRQDLITAADGSRNQGTGITIDAETIQFHQLLTGEQKLAALMGKRMDETTIKSLEGAFLEELTGLRSEGYQDMKALESVALTLMNAGYAPTEAMVQAATDKVNDLAARVERAQANVSFMHTDNTAVVPDLNGVKWDDSLKNETIAVESITQLLRDAKEQRSKLIEAQKTFPSFSTVDLDEIDFPAHAVAVLKGMSDDERAALDPMIAKMFAREVGDGGVIIPDHATPSTVEELIEAADSIMNHDPVKNLKRELEVAERKLRESMKGGGDHRKNPAYKEAKARMQFLKEQLRAAKHNGPLDPEFTSHVMPKGINDRNYMDPDFQHDTQDGSSKLIRLIGEVFRERGEEVPSFANNNMTSRQGNVSPADNARLAELTDDLAHPEELMVEGEKKFGDGGGEKLIAQKKAEKHELEERIMASSDGGEVSKAEMVTQTEAMNDEAVAQSLTTFFAGNGKPTDEVQHLLATLWNADPTLPDLPNENKTSAMNRLFRELKEWGAGGNPLRMSKEEYQEGFTDLLTATYMKTNHGAGPGAEDIATNSRPFNRFTDKASLGAGTSTDPAAGSTAGGDFREMATIVACRVG